MQHLASTCFQHSLPASLAIAATTEIAPLHMLPQSWPLNRRSRVRSPTWYCNLQILVIVNIRARDSVFRLLPSACPAQGWPGPSIAPPHPTGAPALSLRNLLALPEPRHALLSHHPPSAFTCLALVLAVLVPRYHRHTFHLHKLYRSRCTGSLLFILDHLHPVSFVPPTHPFSSHKPAPARYWQLLSKC
jgi:hypothetical protein